MRRTSIYIFLLIAATLLHALAGTASADLVAHWQFEGDFTDATGNGHDGTPHASPSIVGDPARGQVLEVDVVDRVRVADAPDLNYGASESMTLAAWANYEPVGSPTGWKGIVAKGRTEVGGGTAFVDTLYGFWVSPTGNWHINSGGISGDVFAAEGNEWHHLAFVQDASTGQDFFYIDAEVAMTGSAASCDTTGRDLYIGATGTDQATAFEAFKGRIDDVRRAGCDRPRR
ncbi:MAG: LamG-like jellyroll fold domain-containing protein [Planctomycetota bacterium]